MEEIDKKTRELHLKYKIFVKFVQNLSKYLKRIAVALRWRTTYALTILKFINKLCKGT